ncbi:MAG: hypothetical protein WAQ53_04085 [Thiofilum sp.]|uniref:hypothetical protein n=1 Tax=Thiofilum sp. TaxID=2212733 RepID=UPI0025E0750B|nr:hypothetical protein [Thiofilum sp.]
MDTTEPKLNGQALLTYLNLSQEPVVQWEVAELAETDSFFGNRYGVDSGLGDGLYTSYWGLDAQGKPALLVTDFGYDLLNENLVSIKKYL